MWLCGRCCGDNQWRENSTSAILCAHATCPHKPRRIARHRQGFQSKACEVPSRATTCGLASRPASLPFVCHLKVVESSRGRGLTQNLPQYGTALRKTYSPPNPSLLFSNDAEGSAAHPQPNLQPACVGDETKGRVVVFTRVLHRETELTANTGLLTEHDFQGFRRSHDRRVITWPTFEI